MQYNIWFSYSMRKLILNIGVNILGIKKKSKSEIFCELVYTWLGKIYGRVRGKTLCKANKYVFE